MGFRNIPKRHKLLLLPDFKDSTKWLRPREVDILRRCIKYFMDIDTTIQIGFYELYVIYLNMMIQINAILFAKKGQLPNYNTEPRCIKKQICYLFYHYDSFDEVCNYIMMAYKDSDRIKKKIDIRKEFITILKDVYKKMQIERYESFEPFEDTIQKQFENNNENWSKIRNLLIGAEIEEKYDGQYKEKLEQLIFKVRQPYPGVKIDFTDPKNLIFFHSVFEKQKEKKQRVVSLLSD